LTFKYFDIYIDYLLLLSRTYTRLTTTYTTTITTTITILELH